MLNCITLLGRVSKDTEIKKVGETTICEFDLAVDNPRKEADGSRGSSFFKVICFNKAAELAHTYLSKGKKVAILGSIQVRNWVGKDGVKRTSCEVYADNIEFLEAKETTIASEEDESAKEVQPVEEAKYDPYTGKPLDKKPKTK